LNIKGEIYREKENLVKLRRHFHTYPELGFNEFRTSETIATCLGEAGLEVKRGFAVTGVTGLLRGSEKGKTLLIRSDMDALPIQEQTGLPFASQNEGVMHACGHDGHMSMLLTTARILARHREEIKGNILFLFQPNEENAGAERMISEGALSGHNVDAALGLHLWSPVPTGKVGINPGPMMAASHYFYLTIKGRGGHAGMPHKAVDPIEAASRIIESVQHLQTREFDCLEEPTVIMFCNIHGGTSPIVVPEKVELQGSIRFLHERGDHVERRFEEIVSRVCQMTGTEYELEIVIGNRLLSNDPGMTDLVVKEASKIVGRENICPDMRMMVGEDFAEFARTVKSAFYFLGTGNPEKGSDLSHHHPRFTIDEDSLPLGVELHISTALSYLNGTL
jgi:amidohydrolase